MNMSERAALLKIIDAANNLLMNGPNEKLPRITSTYVLENVLDDLSSVLSGADATCTLKLLAEDNANRAAPKCGGVWTDHVWTGGMVYVHDDDAETTNAERVAKGLFPLECERCDKFYGDN